MCPQSQDPNSFPGRAAEEAENSAVIPGDRNPGVLPEYQPRPTGIHDLHLRPSAFCLNQTETTQHTQQRYTSTALVAVIYSGNLTLLNYHTDLLKVKLFPGIAPLIVSTNVADKKPYTEFCRVCLWIFTAITLQSKLQHSPTLNLPPQVQLLNASRGAVKGSAAHRSRHCWAEREVSFHPTGLTNKFGVMKLTAMICQL